MYLTFSPQPQNTRLTEAGVRAALHSLCSARHRKLWRKKYMGQFLPSTLLRRAEPAAATAAPAPIVVGWRLTTDPTRMFGAVERTSGTSARHNPQTISAHITGDTPLRAGRHAWRVRSEEGRLWSYVGIIQAGKQNLDENCIFDKTFYAVSTGGRPDLYFAAGELKHGGTLAPSVLPGECVDLILDVDRGTLCATTPSNGGSLLISDLPLETAWVPVFVLPFSNHGFSVEVLETSSSPADRMVTRSSSLSQSQVQP